MNFLYKQRAKSKYFEEAFNFISSFWFIFIQIVNNKTMYSFILETHNIIRWAGVLLLAIILILSYKGWLGKSNWSGLNSKLNTYFVIGMDIQLLLGLYLYGFLSPMTKLAFNNFGMAMKNADLRFWAVEHILMMVIAIALAHIGKVKVAKANSDKQKFKLTAIFFTLIVIIFAVAIPWERGLAF
jgi:heme A synthase